MAKRLFEFGGYTAATLLLAFGVAALVLGIQGRSEVHENVKRENIVGSPDMTPEGIRKGAEEAKLSEEVLADLPTCTVAGKLVDNGDRAKCFASYMRVHALEASGGKTYSELGRYLKEDGTDTSDVAEAAKDEEGRPVSNGTRDLWVTETALATALNMAFFAEQVSNFSVVVAIALILAGLGFGILAFAAFRWLPAYEARRSP